MLRHIYEHAGIMLDVQYTNDSSAQDGMPTFHSIRVMDSNYRPTGPDLRPMLHNTLIILQDPQPGLRLDAYTLLTCIAEELP